MRRHLKRQLRDKDTSPIERENIEAILEDQQKLDELCDRFQTSRSQGEQEMMIAATDPTEPGGFFRERPLLNWLWENRMQIMQFIFAIMSAF